MRDGPVSFGRYVLLETLSTSAVATVHLAQRIGAAELCALKRLGAQVEPGSVGARRFLREAELASLLLHPHIARLLDAGFEEGPYLAMELVPGQDLLSIGQRLVERGERMPPEVALAFLLQLLSALDHAHELRGPDGAALGLVHRDLSPRNLMCTYGGELKLLDFGVARALLGDLRTEPGMLLGTFRYMSPEQAAALPLDRTSDVYSAAAVFYELLTHRPVAGGQEPRDILAAIAAAQPAPPSRLQPALPVAIDAVFARALAKDPHQRHPTAAAFAHALRAAWPELALPHQREARALMSRLFPEEQARHAARAAGAAAGVLTAESTQLRDSPLHALTRVEPAPTTAALERPRRRSARRRSRRPLLFAVLTLSGALLLLAGALALRPGPAATWPWDQGGAAAPGPPPREPLPPGAAPLPFPTARPSATPEARPQAGPPTPPAAAKRPPAAPRAPAPPALAEGSAERASAAERDPPPEVPAPRSPLRAQLLALEARPGDAEAVLELGEHIKHAAAGIADPELRHRVQGLAHGSGRVGDLDGLRRALDLLEGAR